MKRASLVVSAAAMVVSASAFGAQVTYLENFNSAATGNGTNTALPLDGWTMQAPTTLGGAPVTAAVNVAAVSVDSNSPTAGSAVNSGTPAGGSLARVWFNGAANFATGSANALLYTSEYSFDLGQTPVESFSYWTRDDNPGAHSIAVAIEIDGSWYVSDAQPLNVPPASTYSSGGQTWMQWTTAVGGVNWHPLNFVADTTLDQTISPTTVSLPISGTVNAFGLYLNTSNVGGLLRVDEFSITSVPEPASLAVMGLGALGLLRRRRR